MVFRSLLDDSRGKHGWMILTRTHHQLLIMWRISKISPFSVTSSFVVQNFVNTWTKRNLWIGGPGRSPSTLSYRNLDIPADATPIIIFINSRSGGLYGNSLLPRFRRILHPIQVVDLQEKNPQEALKNYVDCDSVRILVCGGDISWVSSYWVPSHHGSIGWVLTMIEGLHWRRVPAVAILPLGTGNDLARSLNWGSGYVVFMDITGMTE